MMALIHRLSRDEIERDYTHYAKLHGIPIYFNINDSAVCVRNWIPEFLLDIGEFFFGLYIFINDVDEPMYAIKLCGEIKHEN